MSSAIPRKNINRYLDTVAEGAGLRHDNRFEQRDVTDRLLRRANYLKQEDRILLRNIYEHGLTQLEIASLMGLHPQTVSRRARRLCKHVNSQIFSFVLINRSNWSAERRRVAELYFLQKYPIRETVRMSGVSMHHVRKHIQAINETFHSLSP